jgi:hypothetical protein
VDVEVRFFFYLGAVICLVLAALGEGWRFGGRGRRGLAPRLALVPLGLALWLFPTLWDTGVAAF